MKEKVVLLLQMLILLGNDNTINIKVYEVKENNGDGHFEYATSVSSTEYTPNVLHIHYSFQPEYIIRNIKSNSTEKFALSVVSFGAFYTLLSLAFNVTCKRKDFGKRDFSVCS